MSAADVRFDRERLARGFIRAAHAFAGMGAGVDVLAESRDVIRSAFLPDLVCFAECARDGVRCGEDCGLGEGDLAVLRRAVSRVLETGSASVQELGLPSPSTCVVLPVGARERGERVLLMGFAGAPEVPPHALEALVAVGGLVGAALARQQADRAGTALAEERAAQVVREVTEKRARLVSEASKALVASFDSAGTLASLARLLVPQLADWCAIVLVGDDPSTRRQVAWVQVDPSSAGGVREVAARPGQGPLEGAERVIATDESEIHPAVAEPFLAGWARNREQLDAVRGLGLASAMVVPMAGYGAVLGAIALGASQHTYAAADLATAEEIGRRAGTGIENARLYLQAQRAIRVRDQFIAIASHELNTPLTTLLLAIDAVQRALEDFPEPPERLRSNLALLARQGQRLTALVSNLLDVTRIEAGVLHVSPQPMDLSAVVRDVVARHEHHAARARCLLEVAAADPIVGDWDPSRVDQVVSNLLSNALKYGAGKPVSLVAEADGDTARLSVTDRGIGIAPEDHERVFQRFERAVPDDGLEGMGLGLWITREIITRLGGSIRVESQPGTGARFVVELPRGGAFTGAR